MPAGVCVINIWGKKKGKKYSKILIVVIQHGKIMIMFSDISVILLNFPTMDEYFFHNQETYVVLKKQVR